MKKQPTDLTFDGLSAMVTAGTADEKVSKWLDALAGALLVLSPMAVGAPAGAGLALIGAKNELVKAGNSIVERLAKRGAGDRLTRQELLLAVYCLTCYTSFFEAVDRLLPELKKGLDLQPSDQLMLTTNALRGLGEQHGATSEDVSSLAKHRIHLPHPNDPLDENAARLDLLYEHMAVGFGRLIKEFTAWEDADEAARDHITAAVRDLPALAKTMYKGQYQALCAKFHEFAVWANLREHAITRHELGGLAADVRAALELMAARPDGAAAMDIGLADLAAAVQRAVPVGEVARNLDGALSSLGVAYGNAIESPVINDTYASADGPDLQYPRKSEIFVPQAFRAVRFDRRDTSLEHEQTWRDLPVQHDVGRYVLAHLTSPYSLEKPLVVLGQPGSGKSLLTELLAARLASAEYNPIRVTLRDINPDADIQTQIEEQVRTDTGRDVNWAELVERCGGRPPLVILDGYDELLQASGRVFSTYLMKVAAFQGRELGLGQPVRVVVTSRVTLIDKAEVPLGSTVLRLEEFDGARQQKWIGIWNAANSPYFASRDVQPFRLPDDPDVLNLAGQPLLLLMLALYDSDGNRLSKQRKLDQTALYHNLLRRFIRRERGKGEEEGAEFRALPDEEADKVVRDDLKRLGVAAIGMFNRRTLLVSKTELDEDLEFFSAHRAAEAGPGVRLAQAELLLGSFFFVHESRSRLRRDPGTTASAPASFEFLHNTFGEFLAADWILNTVLEETEVVRQMRLSSLLLQALHQRLENGLPKIWFTTLMTTPLFSRPVVLAMVREWSSHRLAEIGRGVEEFAEDLETIFYSQAKRLLSDGTLPPMLLGRDDTPFPRRSMLTNIATYTLNLVLLRCAISGPFQVDLERLRSDEFPKPWVNIVDLWRTGLGQDTLMAVSTVLQAQVDMSGVRLQAKDSFAVQMPGDYLRKLYELADSVGDDQLAALSGWALQDTDLLSPPPLRDLAELPAIMDSKFRQEILRRHTVEEIAKGIRSVRLEREYKNTASSYSTDAEYREAVPILQNADVMARGNPEIGLHIWRSSTQLEFNGHHADLADQIVMTRPRLAADMIEEFHRQNHHKSIYGRSDDRVELTKNVTAAATEMAKKSPELLADPILYEILAHQRRHGLPTVTVERLLSRSANLDELARRSRASLIRLFERSKRFRKNHWMLQALHRLGSRVDGGANFATTFDPGSLMTLLRLSAQHLKTSWITGPDMNAMSVQGLPEWILSSRTSESNHRLVAEEYLLLAASAPDDWKDILGIDANDFHKTALEFYGDDLSVAARKTIKRLHEKWTASDAGS